MSTAFDEASAIHPEGAGRYHAHVPDGWQQGRGAFGGLVLAMLVRAIEREAEVDRPLRALNAEIPSPVLVGPAVLEVEVGRRGSAVSSYTARLVQDGETRARATAVVGAARPVPLEGCWMTPPVLGDPAEVAVAPVAPPIGPAFAVHFVFRPTSGFPFSGAATPRSEGWVAFADPPPAWGAAELTALADTYWPSFFPTVTAPRPAATLSFGLHLTADAHRVEAGQPVFVRVVGHHVAEGFLFEHRELWSRTGSLLAVNPQTVAIIK